MKLRKNGNGNSWLPAILICSLLLVLFTADGICQAVWKSYDVQGPGPRKGQGMAYDSARKKIVLFGGKNAAGEYFNDTWEFDVVAKTWTQRFPVNSPQARAYFAITYDAQRGRTVLQGGQQFSDINEDHYLSPSTWEWDGNNWQLMSTGGPSDRWHARMVYDADAKAEIYFGGADYMNITQNDTWLYNGSWTQLHPGDVPPERFAHAMVYDSKYKRVLMLGGAFVNFGQEPSSQTVYAWSGGNWTTISGGGPNYRSGHAMTFDEKRGVTVLFGGLYNGVIYGDTWELANTTWKFAGDTGSPAPRFNHAMVYDSANGLVWMWGGEGLGGSYDTKMWTYGEENSSDMRLLFVRAAPSQLAQTGKKFNCNVRVRCKGADLTPAFTLELWLSLDKELDSLDTRVFNRAFVITFNPNMNYNIISRCRIPVNLEAGSYYIIGRIIFPKDINTANNEAVSKVRLEVTN